MEIKVIITGVTGFVGEGVLLECIKHPQIKEVLLVNRKPSGYQHAKIKECIVSDFNKLHGCEQQLTGYDACFYCAGISSGGLNEPEYTHITYDTTLNFAKALLRYNPDIVFNFLSGKSTDSSEKGSVMWARVKGKTENALMKMDFKKEYNFRPGFMKPTPGQKNAKSFYKLISGIWPLLFPKASCKMEEVGLSMINAVLLGYPKQTLEVKDIRLLANA